MRALFKASLSVAVALMMSGCAWTTAVRVDPNAPDLDGFVYYECKPLVVLSGASMDVIYVKNPSRAYAVRFGAFLAKNDVDLTFNQDCGVTNVKSKLDTTDIIALLQDALDKVAPDLQPKQVAGTANATAVQLFDVVFDQDGSIIELRPLIKSKHYLIPVPKPAEG